MAVLVEGISVIIRKDALESTYPGGWYAFIENPPNRTLCYDDYIARVGFMNPADVEMYVNLLERQGLVYRRHGAAADIVVADQSNGFAVPCSWAKFGRIHFLSNDVKIAACWFSAERTEQGSAANGERGQKVAMPPGWEYERSLSYKHTYVDKGDLGKRVKYLRSENGSDVYLDLATGKELYSGRPVIDPDSEESSFSSQPDGRQDN
jgi:hypothetical protein